MNAFILCTLPILFSTVNLKLGHKFCQFIHRDKIGIFWVLNLDCISNFFLIHKEMFKFFNVALAGLLNFFQFMKKMENRVSWI